MSWGYACTAELDELLWWFERLLTEGIEVPNPFEVEPIVFREIRRGLGARTLYTEAADGRVGVYITIPNGGEVRVFPRAA